MASVPITCPYCALVKEVPEERVPHGPVRTTCPRCRGEFVFDSAETEAAEAGAPAAPAASGAPPSGSPPEGPPVTGPPAGTPPTPSPIAPSPPPPPAGPRRKEFTGIGETFAMAWEIYKRRAVTLTCLILLMILPFVVMAVAFFSVTAIFHDWRQVFPLVVGIVLAGLVGICIVSVWSGAALVFAVVDERLSFKEALDRSWPRLGSFLWLSSLVAFIVQGGLMLLVVPGLFFLVWFFLSQFFLADDDERGMNALLKSKAYVEGHFLDVALRIFIVLVISFVISGIPVAGAVLSLLFWPFAMIFFFLVYRDLREMKQNVTYPTDTGEKWKWLGAGFLGHLVPVILLLAMMGTALVSGLGQMKSILKGGGMVPHQHHGERGRIL